MKLKRYENNPILKPVPGSWWEGYQTRNPSTILKDGKVYMFYTATGDIKHEHIIYLGLAVSSDGYHFERVSDLPYISPAPEMFDGFDAGGVEDSRIVKIEDTFYLTYMARAVGYVAYQRGKRVQSPPSNGGTWTQNFRRGGLFCSKDLKTWERKGPLTSDNIFEANVCLFPEKINGRFVMLHRPSVGIPLASSKAGMSIAFSKDLKEWVDDKPLLQATEGWEEKVGGSAPPIKTDKGWLTLYHGVEFTESGKEDDKEWYSPFFAHGHHFYRTGIMLLDLEDPSKIIARCPYPILEPEEFYERWGTIFNVVFPCGTVVMDGTLFIYYGGADTVCNVATVGLDELLKFVLQFPCK